MQFKPFTYNNQQYRINNNTITKTQFSYYHTVYLCSKLSTQIITATFNIKKKGQYNGMCIGIDEAHNINTDTYFYGRKETINYGYNGYDGNIYSQGNIYQYGGVSWKEGDIVSMVVNLEQDKISYFINNKQQYNNIKIKNTQNGYRLCVYIIKPGDCVECSNIFCDVGSGKNNNNDDQVLF